jgi:Domain of unknown function (DUF4337)
MNVEELKETTEHAHHQGAKAIGLTTAIVAVLLGTVSLLSHRAHTEEVLLQGKINDQWSFYQAKHSRAHEYGLIAEIAALLPNGKDAAIRELKKSVEEECGAPPEKNCKSPAKDSSVLQALLTELGGDHGESAKAGEPAGAGDAGPPKPAPAAHQQEKPAKESASKEGAVKIQEKARELEDEKQLTQKRADYYDTGELFLEISIVLCSIALLAEAKLYWRLSFLSTALGVGVATWGWFLH